MATIQRFASGNTSPPTGSGWTALTSPTNAYADDTSYASRTSTTRREDAGADYTFANFTSSDIPDSSVINSVTLRARMWGTNATYETQGLQGFLSGSSNGTEVTGNNTSEYTYQFAMTGVTLANLRAASTDIDARVRIYHGNTTTSYTGYCDWVDIYIDYSPPSVTGSFTANAVLRAAVTSSLTANADAKKTDIPGSFTANAAKGKTQSGSATANADLLKTVPGSFTADADRKSTQPGSLLADSIRLRNSGALGFSSDAVRLRDSGTLGFSADAVIRRTQAPTGWTADAIRAWSSGTLTFVADGIRLKNSGTLGFSADAIRLKDSGTLGFSADAVIRKTQSPIGWAIDAIRLRTMAPTGPTADAIRLRNQSTSFLIGDYSDPGGARIAGEVGSTTYEFNDKHADAIKLAPSGTKTLPVDAVQLKTIVILGRNSSAGGAAGPSSFQGDAFQSDAFEAGAGGIFDGLVFDPTIFDTPPVGDPGLNTIDAVIERGFTANAWIGQIGHLTLDAVVQAPRAGTFNAGSIRRIPVPGSVTADARIAWWFTARAAIFGTQQKSFTSDATRRVNSGTKTFTVDARLMPRIYANAVIYGTVGADGSKHFAADARKLNWPNSILANAVKLKNRSSEPQAITNTSTGNVLLVVGQAETVVQSVNVRIGSPSDVVPVSWDVWLSQNRFGIHKYYTVRVRRGDWSVLYSYSGETTADNSSGHIDHFASSINDTAPVEGDYVFTFQSTASTNDVATYSDYRSMSATSVPLRPIPVDAFIYHAGLTHTFFWDFRAYADIRKLGIGGAFTANARLTRGIDRALYLQENRTTPAPALTNRALFLEENRSPRITQVADRALYLEEARAPRAASPADRALYLEESRTISAELVADRALYLERNQMMTAFLSGARGVFLEETRVKGGAFSARARINAGAIAGFSVDAYVAGTMGSFPIDAEIMGLTRTRSFTIDAASRPIGAWHRTGFFNIYAFIAQGYFRIDAVIPRYWKMDATKRRTVTGSFTTDWWKKRFFVADAVSKRETITSFFADALIANGKLFLDAVIRARLEFTADAWKIKPQSFTVNAWTVGTLRTFTADAFFRPVNGGTPAAGMFVGSFDAGAYIRGSAYVIFPEDGGPPTDPAGNPPPARSFRIKIEAGMRHPETFDINTSSYWYEKVTQIQTYVNTYLRIPQLERTQAQNDALAADLATLEYDKEQFFRARTVPVEWVDYTGHIIWAETTFTQQAKTSPGTFTMVLRGAFPEFKGGEEIHVEVDDFRVFGGFVTRVENGYLFDDVAQPKTTLYGVDYSALLDYLRLYNRPVTWENYYTTGLAGGGWDHAANGGGYWMWDWYEKGTPDSTIINHVAREFVDIPYGMDYYSGVDTLDTPAPVEFWALPEPGSPWRDLFQSIVMITSGVFWIGPHQTLEYHSRSNVTAPYPITDGAGGVSCRGLTVSTDFAAMVTDAITWGTLAYDTSGAITYAREYADGHQAERFWLDAVNRMQGYVNTLLAIPASQRTDHQKADLATDQKTLAYDKAQLAIARANPGLDALTKWGRWQKGEWNQEQHHQAWLTKRVQSIIARYGVPIIKAECSIWEPGYQAGQVVQVKSKTYGLDVSLVIHKMVISFAVSQGEFDGQYYAVPRYDLSMGLDPEAPWEIYDYLPYPNVNEGK